jgi:hypothetical protein
LIIRLIIQTIRQDPSGSVWTDEASNLAGSPRPDPLLGPGVPVPAQVTNWHRPSAPKE